MAEQTASNPDDQLCDIGFIGLGVMGKNLALNLADNGYKVACFDLDQTRIDALIEQEGGEGRMFACRSYKELISKVKAPYTIILSVPAGQAVDDVCFNLVKAGITDNDIVVDTGNSLWTHSIKRAKKYRSQFTFFTTAVSGGEVGARFGPSLMASGDSDAWERLEPIFNDMAAKVDSKTGLPIESNTPGKPVKEGEPCAALVGPIGAGHYVKMVHNGIEYADMQIICEAYHVMRSSLLMTPYDIAQVFRKWNKGMLNSYLIEISAEILEHVDEQTQEPLVDIILDKAGQKGTGNWTAVSALEVGSPVQTIAQAVFARSLSNLKDERIAASKCLKGPVVNTYDEQQKQSIINSLEHALYCSKICAYAQGFQLMGMAAKEYNWTLDFSEIAKIWRAGCIIRAVFLQSITAAYEKNQYLENLLVDPFFVEQIDTYQQEWRSSISHAIINGIPCPAMASALSYYDAYRTDVLPANLLQGQRDYFGAHTFQRTDKPRDNKYHIQWSDEERSEVCVKQ